MKNRYLHIANDTVNDGFDTVNDTVKNQNDTVFSVIKQNNKITANEISVKLGKSLPTVKRKIKDLKDRKVIERIGSDETGYWQILKEDEVLTRTYIIKRKKLLVL